jgi:hypothetical protein
MDNIEPKPSTEDPTTARIRALCQAGFETCTPHIVDIATGRIEDAPPAVRVRAHDNLGKYGLGPRPVAPRDTSALLEAIANFTRPYLDEEQFKQWDAQLREKCKNLS